MRQASSIDTPCITDANNPYWSRTPLSSLKDPVRADFPADREFSLVNKLPPEIIIAISEFVVEPRTRGSMFKLVKMTHVCRYWRSTLISFPHLWSSLFVENDGEFVTTCLERSQRVPLAVCLHVRYYDSPESNCTCFRSPSPMQTKERKPCTFHTTILPLLIDNTERIRKLDILLAVAGDVEEDSLDHMFWFALVSFKFFANPLPSLERLSFSARIDFVGYVKDPYVDFQDDMFGWDISSPANLRHLTLHGCYGGPILSLRNLTSFELAGVNHPDRIELNQRTFHSFISGNPSLVSLTLTRCDFLVRLELPRVTPIELPRLKILRLSDVRQSAGFPHLMEIPALKTLSSLHISAQPMEYPYAWNADFRVCAQGDDGFRLSINTPKLRNREWLEDELVSNWLDITHTANPQPAFVRFEGLNFVFPKGVAMRGSPLPLFINAEVLEIDASSTRHWHHKFWEDLEKTGPQLTTLRLEVTEGMDPEVATSVKKSVRARLEKGMLLTRLERMKFEGMDEEEERKSERLWKEFRASLDIDQYIATQ